MDSRRKKLVSALMEKHSNEFEKNVSTNISSKLASKLCLSIDEEIKVIF